MEQSSYSAMLNIAESVPPSEPVPCNSGNSIVIQYNRLTRHWSSSVNSREFHPIPGFRELLPIPESDGIPGIEWRRNCTELHGIPGNSIRFRNSGNRFQCRNRTEFRAFPCNSREFRAIPCNFISTKFPEFRTGIAYLSQRLIFDHNSMREGEGEE